MRILLTGSNNRNDYLTVVRAISVAIDRLVSEDSEDKNIIIVHGAGRGVESLVTEFVNKSEDILRGWGITIEEEKHYPDWERFEGKARAINNTKMVALGADICVAFPSESSKHVWDCIVKARRAGITVLTYKEEDADS